MEHTTNSQRYRKPQKKYTMNRILIRNPVNSWRSLRIYMMKTEESTTLRIPRKTWEIYVLGRELMEIPQMGTGMGIREILFPRTSRILGDSTRNLRNLRITQGIHGNLTNNVKQNTNREPEKILRYPRNLQDIQIPNEDLKKSVINPTRWENQVIPDKSARNSRALRGILRTYTTG